MIWLWGILTRNKGASADTAFATSAESLLMRRGTTITFTQMTTTAARATQTTTRASKTTTKTKRRTALVVPMRPELMQLATQSNRGDVKVLLA